MHSLAYQRAREFLFVTLLMPCYGVFEAGIAFAIEWVAGRPMNDTSDLMMANILLSAGMALFAWLFVQDKGMRQGRRKGVLSVFTTIICSNILLSVLVPLFASAFPDAGYAAAQRAMSSQDVWMLLLYTLFIAPVCEEMVYRRLILHRLRKVFPGWFAVVFSSLLFGMFHGNATQGAYACLMGMVFGMTYQKQGFKMAVLAHGAFNATSVLLGFTGIQELLLNNKIAFIAALLLAALGAGYGLRCILLNTVKEM